MAAALDVGYGSLPQGRDVWGRALARDLPTLLTAALLGLQAWLVLHHVHWRDEVQAYLIVSKAGSLAGVLHALHYEGHPGAWYLLLGLIAAVVPSLLALTLAQALVATANAALVLRVSPFGPWMRLGLLASYFLFFEYGVIARNYGLGATLVLGFLATRRSLWGWAMLAVMANVASHFLILSGALVLAQLWIERRWSWRGAAIWALGCGLSVWTLAPAPDVLPAVPVAPEHLVRVISALHQMSTALLPIAPGVASWGVPLAPPASLLLAMLLPLLGHFALGRDSRATTVFVLFLAAVFLMGAGFYPIYARHVGLAFLLLLALEWMRRDRVGGGSSPVFRAWIAILAADGLWMGLCALVIPFSPADEVAGWISHQGLAARTWAAYPAWHGLDLTARLDVPTYDVQKACLDTYQRWNYPAAAELAPAELRARLAAAARGAGGELYLLSDVGDAKLLAAGARPLASFHPTLFLDPLSAYVVHARPAGPPRPPPACS